MACSLGDEDTTPDGSDMELAKEFFQNMNDNFGFCNLDNCHDSKHLASPEDRTDSNSLNLDEAFLNGNSENNFDAGKDWDSIGAKDLDVSDFTWSKDYPPHHDWTMVAKDTTLLDRKIDNDSVVPPPRPSTFMIQLFLLKLLVVFSTIPCENYWKACRTPTMSLDANQFEALASQIKMLQVSLLKLTMTRRITMLIMFLKLCVMSTHQLVTIIPGTWTNDWNAKSSCRHQDMEQKPRKLEPRFDLVVDSGMDCTALATNITVYKK